MGLSPGAGHWRGSPLAPLLLDARDSWVIRPVNRGVILVCSVAAISCLVVIEEEKVDASQRKDAKTSGQGALTALAPKVFQQPHRPCTILFRRGLFEKFPS